MRNLLLYALLILSGCGYYSFSGSSIPSHMKTIEIPLFQNDAMVHSVAEEVTDRVIASAQKERLTIVSKDGDAEIKGVIAHYDHRASDYKGNRDNLEIKQYGVYITADITFSDKVKGKELYKGRVFGEGLYDFNSEDEAVGRVRAIDDMVQKIMNNALPGW